MTNEQIIDKMLEYEFGEYFYSPVSEIIAIQPSKSTNSSYTLFKTKDGVIHELAVSDHDTLTREERFDDFYIDSDFSSDEYEEFIKNVKLDYRRNCEYFFEIKDVSQSNLYTDNLAKDYISAKSFDRAVVSDNYIANKVDIIEGGRLMKVTYSDDDIEYYTTSYNPFEKKADDYDYEVLDVMRRFYDGVEIRRFFNNPKVAYYLDYELLEMMQDSFDPKESEEDVSERQKIIENAKETKDFSEVSDYLFGLDDEKEWSELKQQDGRAIFVIKYDNQGGF